MNLARLIRRQLLSLSGVGLTLGVLWRGLWHYLELPEPSARTRLIATADRTCLLTGFRRDIAGRLAALC